MHPARRSAVDVPDTALRPPHAAAVAVLAAVLAGCAGQPLPSSPPPSAAISYRIEPPESEGRYKLEPGQAVAAAAEALPDNPLPGYPQDWIGQGLPPLELVVRVGVDRAGTVSSLDIGAPEPKGACDRCADAFRASLERTLRDWRFRPLQIVDWVDGPDEDGDGEPDSVQRAVVDTWPYSVRLRFRYEVRDGRAEVSSIAG